MNRYLEGSCDLILKLISRILYAKLATRQERISLPRPKRHFYDVFCRFFTTTSVDQATKQYDKQGVNTNYPKNLRSESKVKSQLVAVNKLNYAEKRVDLSIVIGKPCIVRKTPFKTSGR
uniref:Transposase n=1 Tax=Ascaris lumbricoides TaxID=6252 RepID=A0A0M3HU51_ASCLU